MKYHNKKGAAIILAILILASILAIAFGASNLMLGETKMSREAPKSLMAYCAAEAGIEKALYDHRKGGGASDIGNPPACTAESGAYCLSGSSDICYSIDYKPIGNSVTIKSYGCYKKVRRSIQVSWDL